MLPVLCRLCRLSNLDGSPLELSTIDDQNTHAQAHLFQLSYISDKNRADFKQIFEQCFPPQQVETNSITQNEKCCANLLQRCLCVCSSRKDNSDPLICRECGKTVRYIKGRRRSHIDTYSILNHACTHLDKKPYGCRYCNFCTSWNTDIYGHLKRIHNIISPSRNKDTLERWATDFDAIVAILNKCYGGFERDSKKTSQDQRTEQQRLCFELVKKYATIGRKIECHLCRKTLNLRDKQSLHYYSAIKHVLTHLKNPIYKCTKCSSSFVSRDGAHRHANSQHSSSFAKIVDDRSDKYHTEIMDLLAKCYDKKM